MDPPGKAKRSKNKPSRPLFGVARHRSKEDILPVSSNNTKSDSNSNNCNNDSNKQDTQRRDNVAQQQQQQQAVSMSSSSDDDSSYVKVRSLAEHSSRTAATAAPKLIEPAIVRQQQQILEDSKKRVQREHARHQQQQQQQQQQQKQNHQRMEPPALEPSASSSSLMKRKSLHKKTPSLSTYQITPITKHYEVSRQILAAFDSHWSNHLWVTAYAVGMQFVETALLELPKHGYFFSKRHERERMENTLEAARVAHLLHVLLLEQEQEPAIPDSRGWTEPTAGLVPSGDLERVQKLLQLSMEQVEQASDDQIRNQNNKREEVEEELRASFALLEPQDCTTTTDWIVCGGGGSSAAAAAAAAVVEPVLSACSERFCASDAVFVDDEKSVVTSTHSILSLGMDEETITTRGTTASRSLMRGSLMPLSEGQQQQQRCASASMTSWRGVDSVSGSQQVADELLLEKALFLSGLEVTEAGSNEHRVPPPKDSTVARATPRKSAAILELATLSMLYHEDFDSLQQTRRVRISYADTYQGRLADSTNGCTVIAPLLCMHHLITELTEYHYETGGDPGLPDVVIQQCIDQETTSVLPPLRHQLGLSQHAFLIPADAHDYLIENGQLSQEQFHSVVGGNILDDSHLNAFVSALEEVKDGKVAATLFFHEHVVAIMKLKRTISSGSAVTWWYDVIDSLPNKATFCRTRESPIELCQRLGIFNRLTDAEVAEESEIATLPKTARIRCLDAEALIAFIRWYACSKFNDENMAYIDQYNWDDSASDFDPRVFQSFIWRGVEYEPGKKSGNQHQHSNNNSQAHDIVAAGTDNGGGGYVHVAKEYRRS